jgi:hypothetical protein
MVFPGGIAGLAGHNQQEVPGRDVIPTSHPRIRDSAQKADQIKIGYGSWGFRQGIKASPSRTPQADTFGQGDCDNHYIRPGGVGSNHCLPNPTV